jgi:hypothetical protein
VLVALTLSWRLESRADQPGQQRIAPRRSPISLISDQETGDPPGGPDHADRPARRGIRP